MLPGRALSVVGAADDNALALLAAALRKLLVTDGKAEVGEIRNIGTVGKNFRAGGHNVVGRNIIANLQESLGLNGILQSLGGGEFLNVGPAQDLHRSSLFLRGGSDHHVVIDEEMLGLGNFYLGTQGSRIGKYTG